MTFAHQGKVIIERDHKGFLLMYPNGDICWQPSKQFAEKAAKKWFRENLDADAGIGEIEWRL